LYVDLLGRLPAMLDDVGFSSGLWVEEDEDLARSERAIDRGEVTIEEIPDLDLAIVRVPESFAPHAVHRFTQGRTARVHPMAVHNRTRMLRVATIAGSSYDVALRYETWVQLVTRRAMPRPDLAPLADRLNERETSGGAWRFDGVAAITPSLHLEHSSIPPADLLNELTTFLVDAPPAWDPYNPR
jgi:hypothetical protein